MKVTARKTNRLTIGTVRETDRHGGIKNKQTDRQIERRCLLTDRPCAKCGKGLHSADDGLRGFSSHFKGKAEPAAANVAQEEDEDDGDLNTE